jgi:shikimate kinase
VLSRRIKRRNDRPLLKGADPVETLRRLIDERYPTYAEADITVESREVAHEAIVDEIIAGLCSQERIVQASKPGGGAS